MTEFDEFLSEEVRKMQGVAYPVKANLFERLYVKMVPCSKLHPNPADEFTFPEVGPNYGIISDYEKKIFELFRMKEPVFEEPVIVEKLHPHGYMIINGHHRWAAAKRINVSKIHVKVINLAQESDIKKILERSKHDKRATFDLDEVVFCADDAPYLEKKLGFPYSIKHKQRIRLGIPALFYALAKKGYDIWVYSANYYSIDDVRDFFRCYGVHVDGIITGMAGDKKSTAKRREGMEKLIANKYSVTLHVDNKMLLRTDKTTGEFEEFELPDDENWSGRAVEILKQFEETGSSNTSGLT